MKKLDSNGYTLGVLLFFIGFFVFVLLVIVVLTYKADRKNKIDLIEEEIIVIDNFSDNL